MNAEVKKMVDRVKTAQSKIQSLVRNPHWLKDARKYAEKQSREVKKLLTADAAKVRSFIETERKNLEKFQKQIPTEVKKLRTLALAQRKELEKLLKSLSQKPSSTKKKASSKKRSASTPKAKGTSKKVSSAVESPQA